MEFKQYLNWSKYCPKMCETFMADVVLKFQNFRSTTCDMLYVMQPFNRLCKKIVIVYFKSVTLLHI